MLAFEYMQSVRRHVKGKCQEAFVYVLERGSASSWTKKRTVD